MVARRSTQVVHGAWSAVALAFICLPAFLSGGCTGEPPASRSADPAQAVTARGGPPAAREAAVRSQGGTGEPEGESSGGHPQGTARPAAQGTRPPERFNGRIPPDLPPVPRGVDGTEFIPDPFFYGEETWDGLEIRLQLYLAYQHKDLAMVAVADQDLPTALAHYRRLGQALAERPVSEVILRDIHQALEDWALRAQCVLLVRMGRQDPAAACLERVRWGAAPGDAAWHAFLQVALHDPARTDPTGPWPRLEARYRRLLPGPPWKPRTEGPASTMAERHRDRLDRLRAYIVWFDPLVTRQPWGVYGPADTQRALWARAVAVVLAEHETPAARKEALAPLWALLDAAPAVRVDQAVLGSVVESPGPVPLLDALVAAENAVQTLEHLQPRTSVEKLQGMPTGDSYLDVLGQAGAPPVGRTEKLSLDDPAHRAWTARYVDAINTAIEAGRAGEVATLLQAMIRELDAYPYDSRYFNIKRVRNEGVRLLVLTGHPDEALALLDGFFPLQDLDFRVPCRQGVLEAMRGRILLEAGRLEEARQAFQRALGHTRRWLSYMDRYRDAPGPAGPARPPPSGGRPAVEPEASGR